MNGTDPIREMIRSVVREEIERAAREAQPVDQITAAEYARRRSISVSTVRAAIADGRLPSVKIGRAVRIPANAEISKHADADDAAWERRKARLLGRSGS